MSVGGNRGSVLTWRHEREDKQKRRAARDALANKQLSSQDKQVAAQIAEAEDMALGLTEQRIAKNRTYHLARGMGYRGRIVTSRHGGHRLPSPQAQLRRSPHGHDGWWDSGRAHTHTKRACKSPTAEV